MHGARPCQDLVHARARQSRLARAQRDARNGSRARRARGQVRTRRRGVRRGHRRRDARRVGRARASSSGPAASRSWPGATWPCPTPGPCVFAAPCRQMWLPDPVDARRRPSDEQRAPGPIIELGAADVPEMLALVERTRPGPFVTRTVELGTYLGIRDDGRIDRDGRRAPASARLHRDQRGLHRRRISRPRAGLDARAGRRAAESAPGTKRRSCTSRSRTTPRTGCTRRSDSRPGPSSRVVGVRAPG